MGAAKGAVIGAVTGAVSGAVTGAVTGAVEGYQEDGWDGVLSGMGKGALKGAVQGAQDGLLSGMVMGGIGGAMNPSFCFVAGTAVLTAAGHRAIEDIKIGDLIPCVDHITGERAEKRVVSTTVKKSDTLVDLVIGGETIRTTTTHPFQVEDKGWVDAGKLQVGDLIYDKDWNTAPVEKVDIITLAEPVEVYNFEVEDCHTYFVGNGCWLVHNGGCTEATRNGIKKHKEWDYGEGVEKEKTIGPGARVDGIDWINHIVYELKPNNPRAIQRGLKQLDRYLDILGATEWAGVLVLY